MINKINKLSKSEFVKVFANIFENAIWIAEKLYNQKPFYSPRLIDAQKLSGLPLLQSTQNAHLRKIFFVNL